MTWKTDDGAIIYVQYFGRVELSDETAAAFRSGEGLPFGRVHFVTQPRFECGDPRYEWLNHTVAIAEETVQLHGAIGITEELWVGRAMKRLLMIAALFGDERAQTLYCDRLRAGEC